MNAMESKKCERCGDFFTIKIGSEISECLNCKSEMESDKMNELPTKKEVTERLQKACDVLNEYLYGRRLHINAGSACNSVVVFEEIGNTSHNIGRAEYRPEPKPPEKNALIIYVDEIKGNLELMYGFSSGFFSNETESTLCITKKYNRKTAFDKWDMTTNEWYCPSTDQKVNWQDAWTPEEFRK